MSITLKNGIMIGKYTNTALSVLLGYNRSAEISSVQEKLDMLADQFASEVTIIGDVSMGKPSNIFSVWKHVLNFTNFASASVPVYQAFQTDGTIQKTFLLDLIQEQAESGVSIITIHPTASHAFHALSQKRIIPCTSRGGSMVYSDMCKTNRAENIYLSELDTIASIARKHNTIISIGTTYRSGTIIDAFDLLYRQELNEQINLSTYLEERGVKTIIETPGHADPSSISQICDILSSIDIPIMPLGPLPTDVAFEYDDLAACIGATLMGIKGCADILTIVTKEEHSGGIPSISSLREAIQKYRVTAHIIDLNKTGDNRTDRETSTLRGEKRTCSIYTDTECSRCSMACPLRMKY